MSADRAPGAIHVVWSVCCGIAIAEAVAGERWAEPWLRMPGYIGTALLFILGCAFTVRSSPMAGSASLACSSGGTLL